MPGASEPRIVWAEVLEFVIEAKSAVFVEIIFDLFARQPGKIFRRCGCQLLYGIGTVFRSDARVGMMVPCVEFAFKPVLN